MVHENLILRLIARLMFPFILLFGIYVLLHGKYSPGGGFQAGVIFAAAYILYALVFGVRRLQSKLPPEILQMGAALGVLLYGGIGLLGMLHGGLFLDYAVLMEQPLEGQFWGIMLVETGIGLTVGCVMLALFLRFATWKPEAPSRHQTPGEDSHG